MIQRYKFSLGDGGFWIENANGDWVKAEDAAKLEADCKRYREALEDIVSIEERRDRGTALVATIARETLREAESTPQRRINHE